MQTRKNIFVKSSHHEKPILTDVFYLKNGTPKPVVIFCHGYKGYKDWGAWNLGAKYFADQGLFFVKFNFSHNGGTSEQPIDFPDLEAFGKNKFSIELNDLDDVIQWVLQHSEFKNELNPTDITLIGHSRGGGIVALKAAEHSRINRLITWCGVSDFEARFPKGEAFHEWKREGITYTTNGRTKQEMPHLFSFYEDFAQNKDRLTIENAIKRIDFPHLIIYGSNDQVVPSTEAEKMHSWNPESKLKIIEGMNHTLGSSQPWQSSEMPNYMEQAVKESLNFILKSSS